MQTLLLLRHAKSSWDDQGLEDYERPLSPRGVRAAQAIGAYMAREHLSPDLVLCSSAVRTRATIGLVLSGLPPPLPDVAYDDDLYLASPADMLSLIHGVDPARAQLMLVGHNPGLHALALALAGTGEPDALRRLTEHMPTAALTVIRFKLRAWSDVRVGKGHLERFVTPRSLVE